MSDSKQAPAGDLNCEQCRELLSDYVDRELSDGERASVEKHLGNCSKCGTESQRLVGLKNVVQHWHGVKGSGEFRSAVVQQMIRESQQMPAEQFIESARASQRSDAAEGDNDVKTIPPFWILLVFTAIAALAYFVVLKLRGM